jgi:hypothetical protein
VRAVGRGYGIGSGELHRVEVVVVGFAAAAEAPGHRLEGDVAEGRGDENCNDSAR